MLWLNTQYKKCQYLETKLYYNKTDVNDYTIVTECDIKMADSAHTIVRAR